MALPTTIDSTTPAGSASPSLGDDQIRAYKLAVLDILGIPDNVSITQAAFDVDAGGLAQAIFYDAAVTPASGELGRSGATLYYRITDARTATTTRPLGIIADTTGTPAASIGVGMLFQAESADEAPSDFGALDFVASDVTAATEDTNARILLRVAGRALDEKYRFQSTAGDGFTAIFTHAVTADRTYTLPDNDATLGGFAAGTVMLFRQTTAPTGWTRTVDAAITDSVIIARTNAEVPTTGGTWTISGLTFSGSALGTHTHSISTQTADLAGAASTVSNTSITGATSAGTPAGTIASSGAWRPLFIETILATRD